MILKLGPRQWWHLAGSTGTTWGRAPQTACVELPCVWSRIPSRTRLARAVWEAGPDRFVTDAGHSHGSCKQIQTKEILKINTAYLIMKFTSKYTILQHRFIYVISNSDRYQTLLELLRNFSYFLSLVNERNWHYCDTTDRISVNSTFNVEWSKG
jgi:hypothetical protein